MIESLPGDTVVTVIDGLPSGLTGVVGVHVERASNGTVVLARTTIGVVERPVGSGNYVATFVAPVEGDTYLVVGDDDPAAPTVQRVVELRVSATVSVDPSGLGPIADAAKSHLGGTFDGLVESDHYGASFVLGRVSVVKRRMMIDPPATADEGLLDELVIDYLGKLVVIELMPAAIDYWAHQYQSESIGNDPVELATYPDRLKAMEAIQELMITQTRRDEALVMEILAAGARLRKADSSGPSISEVDDCRVTADPSDFPTYHEMQYGHRRRPTGMQIG